MLRLGIEKTEAWQIDHMEWFSQYIEFLKSLKKWTFLKVTYKWEKRWKNCENLEIEYPNSSNKSRPRILTQESVNYIYKIKYFISHAPI